MSNPCQGCSTPVGLKGKYTVSFVDNLNIKHDTVFDLNEVFSIDFYEDTSGKVVEFTSLLNPKQQTFLRLGFHNDPVWEKMKSDLIPSESSVCNVEKVRKEVCVEEVE